MKNLLVYLLFLSSMIEASGDFEPIAKNQKIAQQRINNSLTAWEAIQKDYQSFYAPKTLERLAIGFGLGGVAANTQLDNNFQNWYQENIRSNSTDEISKVAKTFGEGKIMIPVALLSATINYIEPKSSIGVWGVYTSRAYLVGAPAVLLMQVVTGASRPDESSDGSNESNRGSKWKPFNDNNGVSGHAFVGAVPFLTLAHLYAKNKPIKYLAYLASFATAWSRMNDNAHYLSQASLGWYMAYESVDAVFDADRPKEKVSIYPIAGYKSMGVSVQMHW